MGTGSYLDCFKSTSTRIRFRTLTGIAIQAWQQLTGINFIFYYVSFSIGDARGMLVDTLQIGHNLLQKLRYLGPLPHHNSNQRGERRHDHSRHVGY